MTVYLSRLQVSRDPSIAALSALIEPDDSALRADAQHRLLWSAFAGDAQATRDFLWRADGKGAFVVLSHRPPTPSPLFEPHDIRPFVPDLRAGDRLAFVLRANATRQRKGIGRVDVVMDGLHGVSKDQRAEARMQVAQEAGHVWLVGQGARAGFDVVTMTAADYSVLALPGKAGAGQGGRRRGQPQFGILELTGTITVTDPPALVAKLAQGFGRARAFGCGLMMIRRA